MALNARQESFAQRYAVSGNATQSAIEAGYSEHTAAQQASRLLKNVKVSTLIRQLQEETAERLELTHDRILTALWESYEATRPREDLNEDGETVVFGNPSAANRALELIGKHLGMFTERVHMEHSGGIDIRINGVDLDALR